MSLLGDEWNSVTSGISNEWHKFTNWVGQKKDEITSTVTNGVNTVTTAVSDEKQKIADDIDDAKHPIYSAIETGLTAIFGKQAMKWLVDTLLGFFGNKGGNNVQSFGSGDFTDTLTRWQRELNRDLGTKPTPPPQAKPAPT